MKTNYSHYSIHISLLAVDKLRDESQNYQRICLELAKSVIEKLKLNTWILIEKKLTFLWLGIPIAEKGIK